MVRSKYKNTSSSTKEQQQEIYDHLLYCVKTESPIEVLERFNHLFIKATGYQEASHSYCFRADYRKIQLIQNFPRFFNRCCHIIVNRWQMPA